MNNETKWRWKSLSRVQLFATPWTIQSMNSPGQNTGVGSLSLLQGIFPTQGLNPGFPHCRWILYQLSHKRSPSNLTTNTIFEMHVSFQPEIPLSRIYSKEIIRNKQGKCMLEVLSKTYSTKQLLLMRVKIPIHGNNLHVHQQHLAADNSKFQHTCILKYYAAMKN